MNPLDVKTDIDSFKVYIDLFNKGELSELNVIADKGNYALLFDTFSLGIITKDNENSWIRVKGTIPNEKLLQVGNLINLRLNDNNRIN